MATDQMKEHQKDPEKLVDLQYRLVDCIILTA